MAPFQKQIRVIKILTITGIFLIVSAAARADSTRGKGLYQQNCAPCHGAAGKGDGPGAQSLPVRPADHTDSAAMSSRSDAFLRDVITKGGGAMGLSSFMPSWKGILNDDQIQDLVDYIRTLAARPK
ncbi:MAG TPA: cytochrome c [Terriglobales bacterium]|nr:cytochrome c [Terriglobales bacterium]